LARQKEDGSLCDSQHSRGGIFVGPRHRDVGPTRETPGADCDPIAAPENDGDDERAAIWRIHFEDPQPARGRRRYSRRRSRLHRMNLFSSQVILNHT